MRHCEFESHYFLSFSFILFKFDFNMYYMFSFACLWLFNTLIINNFILGSRKRYIKHFSITEIEIFSITYGPGHAKTCLMSYANNKGADQPAHPRSLISTFVVRYLDSMICILAISNV